MILPILFPLNKIDQSDFEKKSFKNGDLVAMRVFANLRNTAPSLNDLTGLDS